MTAASLNPTLIAAKSASAEKAPWWAKGLVAAWVGVAGLTGLGLAYEHQQTIERLETESDVLVEALEHFISSSVHEVTSVLDTVATDFRRLKLNLASRDALMARLREVRGALPGYADLAVLNEQGLVVASTGGSLVTSTVGIDKTLLQQMQVQTGVAVGEPVVSRETHQLLMPIALRLEDAEGRAQGFVMAGVHLSYFRTQLNSLRVGSQDAVALIGSKGEIYARKPDPVRKEGSVVRQIDSPSMKRWLASGLSAGGYTAPSITDNVERAYRFRRVGPYPLIVSVGLATSNNLSTWRHLGYVAAGLWLLGGGLGWGLYQQIRRSQRLARAAWQRLNQQQGYPLAMVRDSPVPRLTLDPDTLLILSANRAAVSLLDEGLANQTGQSIHGYLACGQVAGLSMLLTACRKVGEGAAGQLKLQVKEGVCRSFLTEWLCAETSEGTCLQTAWWPLSVEEARLGSGPVEGAAEGPRLANAYLTEQVAQLKNELALANCQLATAYRAKALCLAGINQELRPPLTSLLGMVGVLQHKISTVESQSLLAKMQLAGQQVQALLGNVMDMARLEGDALERDVTHFSLAQLLQEAESQVRPLAEAKGLTLIREWIVTPALEWVQGDVARIQRALVNYLYFALRTTMQGRVRIRCLLTDRGLDTQMYRFEVENTGPGLLLGIDQLLPDTFERWVSGTQPAALALSGGVAGLYLTQQLVEAMGGVVGMTPKPGEGSCFWFTLPLKPGQPAPPAEANREIDTPETLVRRSATGKQILLIEGDPLNLEVASFWLVQVGFQVEAVQQVGDALRKASATAYDLVVLDVLLATDTEMGVARQLRELPGYANTPVIAVTALSFTAETSYAAGLTAVVMKPFSPEDLYQALMPWV